MGYPIGGWMVNGPGSIFMETWGKWLLLFKIGLQSHLLWFNHFHPGSEWKSWALSKCKVFIWLAIKNKCWTADRLARSRLSHPANCVLWYQKDETVQHILVRSNGNVPRQWTCESGISGDKANMKRELISFSRHLSLLRSCTHALWLTYVQSYFSVNIDYFGILFLFCYSWWGSWRVCAFSN